MKSASITTVAFVVVLFAAATVHAAAKSCLTGTDPSVASDLPQIAAVRDAVAAACPCSSFDDSKGLKHANYVKCAKGVIADAVATANLRKQCKATVTQYYSVSTCGLPPSPPAAPCITTSAKGKVTCAIKSTAKCKGNACPAFTTCIDAADTNGDGLIGAGDSGACNSVNGPTPTATPPLTEPTPTVTPPPMPPSCTPVPMPMQFTASMDGAQAGTMSAATGSCTGTLSGTSFSIMCTDNVMNPTAAHIHMGAPGVAGPIVFPFNDPSNPSATWMNMMCSDVANLISGNLYVNVHSNNCMICPAGEIRGQLLPAP